MKFVSFVNFRKKTAAAVSCGIVASLLTASAVSGQTAQPTTDSTDVQRLNMLLALQNVQAAYLTAGLAKFQASDFASYAQTCAAAGPLVYPLLQAMASQSAQQITALQNAITTGGGTPVAACTYNFTFTTPQAFIGQAVTFSNAASSYYVSTLGATTTNTLRTNLATIAAVQARQSAFLDVLNASNPFPVPFEPTTTQADIDKTLAPFITSCPSGGGGNGGNGNGITAVAGPKTVTTTVSKQITLDATASTVPTGVTPTYQWTVASDSPRAASIIGANTASPTVQFVQGYGIYKFQLTVTGASGATATDTISILYVGR